MMILSFTTKTAAYISHTFIQYVHYMHCKIFLVIKLLGMAIMYLSLKLVGSLSQRRDSLSSGIDRMVTTNTTCDFEGRHS